MWMQFTKKSGQALRGLEELGRVDGIALAGINLDFREGLKVGVIEEGSRHFGLNRLSLTVRQ